MRRIELMALSIGALGVVACGGGEAEPAPATPTARATATAGAEMPPAELRTEPVEHHHGMASNHDPDGGEHAEGCPMQVPGVRLETEDIEGGVALVFTTTEPDHVTELRALVRAMVPTTERHPASAESLILEPPAQLSVEDIPGGARLDLRAQDPNDIAALRRQGRLRADLLLRGACPLLPPQQASLPLTDARA